MPGAVGSWEPNRPGNGQGDDEEGEQKRSEPLIAC
jgi:hypothetical protein